MIAYRDMTFCKYYETCLFGSTCPRALTEDVEHAADKAGLDICQFSEQPECYTEVVDETSA